MQVPQTRIEEYLKAIIEGWAEATAYPYPEDPVWRIEEFLDAFITYIWEDGDNPRHPCPDPVWRIEECLRAIYDVMVGAETPWAFPTPTNRIETYLAAIHAYLVDGTELGVPEPVWRIEDWLAGVLEAVKSGGGGTETTVTGPLPLTLANALSHAILSLTRYGLCEQRNLPSEYTELDYINPYSASTAAPKIDLDIKDDVDDMVYEVWCTPCTSSWYVLQSRASTSDSIRGITGSASNNTIIGACYGYSNISASKNGTAYNRNAGNPVYVRYEHKNGHHDIYVKDLTTGDEYTGEGDSQTAYSAGSTNIILFGNSVDSQYIIGNPTTHARITKSGVVVRDLYPANDGTNNGFYDMASGRMFLPASQSSINAGSVATPSPKRSMDLWCNNGVLTKPHDTYTAVDGQGTYVTPGTAANRIYKALSVGDGNYTITVPAAFDFIVQYKTPAEGSLPTDYGNIGTWVNGTGTVTLDKGTAYCYGIALRDHVAQSGNISPSDFSGTIVVVHDDEPVKAVGTPETLTVSGINLCNPDYYQGDGWYVSGNNTIANANANGTLVFPCKPNTTYSWWHTEGVGGGRAFELSTDTVTVGQEASWAVGNPAYNDAMTVRKYTTSASAKLLCVCFARVDAERVGRTREEQLADFMLVEGDITTATSYEPYHAPQTVTDIPMLLSVGDYKDELEFVGGSLTHRIAIKVFDGTETPTAMSTAGAYRYAGASSGIECLQNTMVLCTHYKPESPSKVVSNMDDLAVKTNVTANNTIYFKDTSCQTVEDLQAKFAALYAAGTPVILLVVLAEETTEQTTAQHLVTHEGTNIVDSTAAAVEAEVKYMEAS